MKLPTSAAASALLRALTARWGVPSESVLLTDIRSVDWRSLTFSGERHEIHLRIRPPEAGKTFARLCDGLDSAELETKGHIVADIALMGEPDRNEDGSISIAIEALTVIDDCAATP
jgi:hypothetical protein